MLRTKQIKKTQATAAAKKHKQTPKRIKPQHHAKRALTTTTRINTTSNITTASSPSSILKKKRALHHNTNATFSSSILPTASETAAFRHTLKTATDIMRHNPRQALAMLTEGITHSGIPTEDLTSPHYGKPKLKHIIAQQSLFYAALLTSRDDENKDTSATTTAVAATDGLVDNHRMKTHHELPTDLPMPGTPEGLLLKKAAIPTEDVAPLQAGLTIQPEFIPPTPSRTIPIIHDGLEWDEPNILIKPFVNAIDLLHDASGLPWWGALVSWAWILRSSISPLTYKQHDATAKFTLLQPELLKLNQELRAITPGTAAHKDKQAEISALYKKHGVGPFTAVFWSLSNMPFYILSFLSIRNMANSPYFAAEFSTGGFEPYIDLSVSAGWKLAAVNACVNLVMIHASQPVPTHKMQKLQKIMFLMSHAVVLCTIPLLANINTASIFYFIANNSFSILLQRVLYSDIFRKVAGMPLNSEVQAVRDIIQQMQLNPATKSVPEGANKGAYLLDKDGKAKTGLPTNETDILAQARKLLKEQEEQKKAFATGGAEALEKLKKEKEEKEKAEKEKVKEEAKEIGQETAKAALGMSTPQKDYKMDRIGGYKIHTVGNNAPRPDSPKAKQVKRKGWVKH